MSLQPSCLGFALVEVWSQGTCTGALARSNLNGSLSRTTQGMIFVFLAHAAGSRVARSGRLVGAFTDDREAGQVQLSVRSRRAKPALVALSESPFGLAGLI